MTTITVRGIPLFVDVIGRGYPLLLMHGGPGFDHTTLAPFRRLADRFTLIFYDHRCNGRSVGPDVTTMTWENLAADAEALRQALGIDRWAVLGHSFGGMVALEYALRYPQSLSHLLLVDACGDSRWAQQNAPAILAQRGYPAATVETARRFYHGQIAPSEMTPALMKLARAYYYHLSPWLLAREAATGVRVKTRPEAFIFGYSRLFPGWTVMDRLPEIKTPALVLAGRHDFQFPPEHQAQLAAGLPNAQLVLIERAGHNAPSERPAEMLAAVTRFMGTATLAAPAAAAFREATHAAVDAYVEQERQRLKIPGVALAIVEDGQIVHFRGFGQARPGGEPPGPHTPFLIGSLTKSFTALAAMQLVEAGRIELDAPVQRYLPWFRVADAAAAARITVRHLLNQTSGLPGWAGEIALADFDASPGATERQARGLASTPPAHPPGAAFEYSNANYNLLGLVIEAAAGAPYADYVQDHIFTPLAMGHSYSSRALAQENGLAVGHRYWFGYPVAAPNTPVAPGSLPSGQHASCAEDLARYLVALLNGGRYDEAQILSPAGIDELHRGAADFRAMGRDLGQYGMGWFVDDLGETKLVWHGGTLPDFGAYMALLPEQKKGIVLLFNASHHWMNPVHAELGTGATALLAGEQHAPVPLVRQFPWLLRGQLLLPALQLAGVAATLRRLRRWRRDPEQRPRGPGAWAAHLLWPLVANLLPLLTLRPLLGRRRDYVRLYIPDSSWLAIVCSALALAWSFLRTGLVLRALKRTPRPRAAARRR